MTVLAQKPRHSFWIHSNNSVRRPLFFWLERMCSSTQTWWPESAQRDISWEDTACIMRMAGTRLPPNMSILHGKVLIFWKGIFLPPALWSLEKETAPAARGPGDTDRLLGRALLRLRHANESSGVPGTHTEKDETRKCGGLSRQPKRHSPACNGFFPNYSFTGGTRAGYSKPFRFISLNQF